MPQVRTSTNLAILTIQSRATGRFIDCIQIKSREILDTTSAMFIRNPERTTLTKSGSIKSVGHNCIYILRTLEH